MKWQNRMRQKTTRTTDPVTTKTTSTQSYMASSQSGLPFYLIFNIFTLFSFYSIKHQPNYSRHLLKASLLQKHFKLKQGCFTEQNMSNIKYLSKYFLILKFKSPCVHIFRQYILYVLTKGHIFQGGEIWPGLICIEDVPRLIFKKNLVLVF